MNRIFVLILLCAAFLHAGEGMYDVYNGLLKKYVCEAGVDYKRLKTSGKLDRAIKPLDISMDTFEAMDKDERVAYLINLYNAYTLKLIVDNYPLKSIRDLKDPWKRKFVPLFGKKVSLDHVEHKVLRKKFNEPRIHFALVCASIGCPALRNTAFTGKDLYAQLNQAGQDFLNDRTKNRYERKIMHASLIFKWYGSDFNDKYGSFKTYIQRAIDLPQGTKFAYLKYDWNLNEAAKCDK